MLFSLLRPAVFAFNPERAHDSSLSALGTWARAGAAFAPRFDDSVLHTRVAGLAFANPIGLAAGVDKNGRAIDAWHALGFGAVEVGTLTPLAQPGNARPRLFRLAQDRAVINRFGFNNNGLAAGLARAAAAKRRGVVGVNVGANKDARDRLGDYRAGVAMAAPIADYVTVNISSPNTPGLRDLQAGTALVELLAACMEARGNTPLFLKIAPDLTRGGIDEIARAAIEARVDGIVIGNTTISRPPLCSTHAGEAGGLSGAPLAPLARAKLAELRTATSGKLPLIAAGGVDSAAEAYARIRAGASLVQLYTALIYEGPALPARIARELAALVKRDGFASVGDAVGTAAD